MVRSSLAGAVFLAAMQVLCVHAAEPSKRIVYVAPPPDQTARLFSEVRFGFSIQGSGGPEDGTMAFSGEMLFEKPLTMQDTFAAYFIPRPHVGGSVNVNGGTNYAYAGLTWTFDLTPNLFVEGSLGGAIHDGYTGALAYAPDDRAMLGCSPAFRQAGGIGYKVTTNWSVIASVENLTNFGACNSSQSLTNFGARFGYSF